MQIICTGSFPARPVKSYPATCQKQVDMESAPRNNPERYSGSCIGIGVGFSGSSFKSSDRFDGIAINPLHFHLDFGKRIRRKYGCDRHLNGRLYIGLHAYLSYASTWETGAGDAANPCCQFVSIRGCHPLQAVQMKDGEGPVNPR